MFPKLMLKLKKSKGFNMEALLWSSLGPDEESKTGEEDMHHLISDDSSDEGTGVEVEARLTRLSQLEAVAVSLELERAADQLAILGLVRPKSNYKMSFKTLEERFGRGELCKTMYDPETNEPMEGTEAKRMWRKLERDRDLLMKVIEVTREELSKSGTFAGLKGWLSAEREEEEREASAARRLAARSSAVASLRAEKAADEAATKTTIAHNEKQLVQLEDELQAVMYKAGTEKGFSERWEEARLEMDRLARRRAEEGKEASIRALRKRIAEDRRVDDEVKRFLAMSIQNLEAKIKYWTDCYDSEVSEKDLAIANIKNKMKDTKEKSAELTELLASRQASIDDWLGRKAAMQAAEDRRLLEIAEATRIQAWWRGTMVRRHLGPYAVAPGRRGAAKAEAASKKGAKKKKK